MTVSVFEHYRPVEEDDQMLMVVSGIDYVKSPIGKPIEFTNYSWSWYEGKTSTRLFFVDLDMRDVPKIINDFIFYYNIPQPATLSLYTTKTTGISYMPVVIRDILENNLLSR